MTLEKLSALIKREIKDVPNYHPQEATEFLVRIGEHLRLDFKERVAKDIERTMEAPNAKS